MKFLKLFTVILFAAFLTMATPLLLYAQTQAQDTSDSNAAQVVTSSTSGHRFITNIESNLSMLVLAFGIVIIFLEVYLIKANKIDANNSIKFIILTLIITGTLFLITAGYDTQLTPVLGLLGTIAGYLLGKGENAPAVTKEKENV